MSARYTRLLTGDGVTIHREQTTRTLRNHKSVLVTALTVVGIVGTLVTFLYYQIVTDNNENHWQVSYRDAVNFAKRLRTKNFDNSVYVILNSVPLFNATLQLLSSVHFIRHNFQRLARSLRCYKA